MKPDHPDVASVQARAGQKSTEARTKALQAIKPLVLKRHDRNVGQGLRQDPNLMLRGPVATATIDGVTGRYVVGPSEWSGVAVHRDLSWRFGIVDGKAVHLVPEPKLVSETTIAICGCEVFQCGPVGSGCPGCGSTTQVVFGPLPDGIDYAGDHVVPYSSFTTILQYRGNVNGAACPAPRVCPQPPSTAR